ncbi:MAG: FAD:protein transferase [Solirubrobacterales bacterium]|nr:FAD:protein transferase [Solirubrobacterales bacterium]
MSFEAHLAFPCFGATAAVHVRAATELQGRRATELARLHLLDAHRRLTRFDQKSELSRLNRDPRAEVPASPLVRRLAAAVRVAGERSGGLVDATLLDAIEAAGYTDSLGERSGKTPSQPVRESGDRAAGRSNPAANWRRIQVDERAGIVTRPPGLRIDGGGIVKGLLADLVAESLADSEAYAVDCCGDIRLGGVTGRPRTIRVEDPFGGGQPVHELSLHEGAVATSGINRRSWLGPAGEAAHQILDPFSGRPAFTGLVQVTAVAPTALLAEVHAKAALLSGPERAAAWLPHGGITVSDQGEVSVVLERSPLAEPAAAA